MGNHNPRAANSQTFMSKFQREIHYITNAYYVGFQRSAVSLKYTYICIKTQTCSSRIVTMCCNVEHLHHSSFLSWYN